MPDHTSPDPATIACPACGADASGSFCGRCGGSLGPRRCAHCAAELSARARFCHRCGHPVAPGAARARPGTASGSEQTAWIIAGALVVLLVGAIVWRVERGTSAPAIPDMANPGAEDAPFAGRRPTGPAPDISAMSPRERFDRLFNRIMTAAEQGDTNTVVNFTPMALGAYNQLDTVDTDARYHAALLLLQTGNVQPALALADTIEATHPGHLFGYLIRGRAAELAQNDTMRRQAYRDFLAHLAAEEKANRPEYREHQPAIDAFRKEAEQATGGKR